jgi:hypothetical protein
MYTKIIHRIDILWNALHYCIFIWIRAVVSGLEYLSPIPWLLKKVLPFSPKKGITVDQYKTLNAQMFMGTANSYSANWAHYQIGGVFVLIEFIALNILLSIAGLDLWLNLEESKLLMIVGGSIMLWVNWRWNNRFLYRDDRYLLFFAKFEKKPKMTKLWYSVASIAFIAFLFVLFLLSMALAIRGATGMLSDLRGYFSENFGHR